MKECCGNCKYNKRDFSKPQGKGYSEFCCGNEDRQEDLAKAIGISPQRFNAKINGIGVQSSTRVKSRE